MPQPTKACLIQSAFARDPAKLFQEKRLLTKEVQQTNKKAATLLGGRKLILTDPPDTVSFCPLRMAAENYEVAVSCVQLENSQDKTMCQAELENSCGPSVHISNSPLTWLTSIFLFIFAVPVLFSQRTEDNPIIVDRSNMKTFVWHKLQKNMNKYLFKVFGIKKHDPIHSHLSEFQGCHCYQTPNCSLSEFEGIL